MITGGYKVQKSILNMTREEREQFEKTRKKYDPKNIFKEQNEPQKKSGLTELKPNRKETKEIIERLYGKPDTPDLWADDSEKES